MTKYMIVVNPSDNADSLIAYGFGSFKAVAVLAKEALAEIKDQSGEFTLRVTEVAEVGDTDAKRVVASVSGEADVVAFITKKKLAVERKAQGGSDKDSDDDAAE